MTLIVQAFSIALVHFVWQGAIVGLLLWMALHWLRNGTPNSRYAACCIGLSLMAVLPVFTTWVLFQSLAFPSGRLDSFVPHVTTKAGTFSHAWKEAPFAGIRFWILPAWATGASLFALRFLLSFQHVSALRRRGRSADQALCHFVSALARRMNVRKYVRVLISNVADSPCVIGWLRPVLLLPAATLVSLEARQLEMILAHELAHIRRHDYLVNFLQTAMETLLFYHPAVWWASARMRQEREYCCDDVAVRFCGDTAGYARTLTLLERLRSAPDPAMAASGGSLLYRIQRLNGSECEGSLSRMPAVFALLAVTLGVFLLVHQAQGQSQKNNPALSSSQQNAEQNTKKASVGTVLVEATLDGNGNVLDARVLSGPMALRKAGLRSVLERRFANAKQGEVRQVSISVSPEETARLRSPQIGTTEPHPQSLARSPSVPEPTGQFHNPHWEAGASDAETKRLEIQLLHLQSEMDHLKRASSALEHLTFLEQQLAEAQNTYMSKHPDVLSLTERIMTLQEQMTRQQQETKERSQQQDLANFSLAQANQSMQALHQQLAEVSRLYTNQHPMVVALQNQIQSIQAQLLFSQVGGKLVRVENEDLLSGFELPVKIGDQLTPESMQKIQAALAQVHPNLEVHFYAAGKEGVVIQVTKR